MNYGAGSYLTEEMFEGLDYEAVRDEALGKAPELGEEFLENSVTAAAYASDTAGEGLSLQRILRDRADTEVEEAAARMIRYEFTEAIRSRTLKAMDEDSDAFQAMLVDGQTPEEELQRAFFLVDREQRGYIDIRPDSPEDDPEPSRYPRDFTTQSIRNEGEYEDIEEDNLKPMDESEQVRQHDLGALNLSGIYVMNDDWIMYRNGRQPLGVDEEIREDVEEFLVELGVAGREPEEEEEF